MSDKLSRSARLTYGVSTANRVNDRVDNRVNDRVDHRVDDRVDNHTCCSELTKEFIMSLPLAFFLLLA